MHPDQLTQHLLEELPLAHALRLRAVQVEANRVIFHAPFAANRNGHGTAFGGSLATLGILAGWAMVYTRLKLDGLVQDLVIRNSECRFEAPIVGEIQIEAAISEAAWQAFRQWLAANGKARIEVQSRLRAVGGAVGAIHTGSYVALAPGSS